MRCTNIALAAVAAAAPTAVLPAAAEARKTLCATAYPVRMAVVAKHGKRAPGRNVCRHGVKIRKGKARRPTNHEKGSYLRQLRRLRQPRARAVPPRQPPGGALTARTGFTIPRSIVMCESGGNYNAHNPSGAHGAYQIMPGTHAAICPDLSWSPPDQDTCAARIWATQGRSAWVC